MSQTEVLPAGPIVPWWRHMERLPGTFRIDATVLKDRLMSKAALLWYVPLLLFTVERFFWPLVASWREDEATVMWIGRKFASTDLTVGLVSSTGLPNPNGLLWIAKLISFAPDLYWSGVFLQLLHLGALLGICLVVARRVSLGAGVGLFALIGCLVAYRGSCSEPFSQWVMLPTTLGCSCLLLLCLQTPSFKLLFGVLALLWLPPALYIAGVLNSVVFAVALGACACRASFRERLLKTDFKLPLLAFLGWSAVQLLFIWKPYFSMVSLAQLKSVSSMPAGERVERAFWELLRLPVWIWQFACDAEFRPSLYNDAKIVTSPWFGALGHASQWLFRALALAAAVLAYRGRLWRQSERWPWVYAPLALLALALVLSPLLGGPSFSRGERPDIGFQFASLILLPIAVCLSAPNLPKSNRVGVLGLGLSFVASQMIAGVMALFAHNYYSGETLSGADVPLRQKMEVIDTIVREAREHDIGPEIPIDYAVDGLWRWIRRFRPKILEQYGSPYTLGRAFDYDLDRRYGIKNALEGRRRSTPRWGFWVNYSFERPLKNRGKTLREIGRLRLGYRPPPARSR